MLTYPIPDSESALAQLRHALRSQPYRAIQQILKRCRELRLLPRTTRLNVGFEQLKEIALGVLDRHPADTTETETESQEQADEEASTCPATCAGCPFARDRDLGLGRLICTAPHALGDNEVVRSHHEPGTDCRSDLEASLPAEETATGDEELIEAIAAEEVTSTSKSSNEFAHTIIQQLGGLGKLEAMVAASHLVYDTKKRLIHFRFKGNRRINSVTIRLNSLDLYNVVFHKIPSMTGMMRGDEIKDVATFEDVQAEKLVEIFETTTGLRLSLF